jgi:hypothetical protein
VKVTAVYVDSSSHYPVTKAGDSLVIVLDHARRSTPSRAGRSALTPASCAIRPPAIRLSRDTIKGAGVGVRPPRPRRRRRNSKVGDVFQRKVDAVHRAKTVHQAFIRPPDARALREVLGERCGAMWSVPTARVSTFVHMDALTERRLQVGAIVSAEILADAATPLTRDR